MASPSKQQRMMTAESECSSQLSQTDDASSVAATTDPVPESKPFLTREKLLTVNDDKLRRRLAPVRKWASLTVGYPYMLKRIISIEVNKKDGDDGASSSGLDLSYYAELESETEPLVNAWLTSIMIAEAENFDLTTRDVYIIPLGKRISQENKKEYHSFVIVRGDELDFLN